MEANRNPDNQLGNAYFETIFNIARVSDGQIRTFLSNIEFIGTLLSGNAVQVQNYIMSNRSNFGPNLILPGGLRPLHIAAAIRNNSRVLSTLITHGAIVNDVDGDDGENGGLTALHVACRRGHLAYVSVLLDQGQADIHVRSNNHQTPLFRAVTGGHSEIVSKLLQTADSRGELVSMWTTTLDGLTPLHCASMFGHTFIINLLLSSFVGRVDCAVGDNDGSTALHFASAKGHVEAATALLHAFPFLLERADTSGMTPLMFALIRRQYDMAELFVVRWRANVNRIIGAGTTMLALAARRADVEICRFLLRHGATMDIHVEHNRNYDFELIFLTHPIVQAAIGYNGPNTLGDQKKEGQPSDEARLETIFELVRDTVGRNGRPSLERIGNAPSM